MKEQNRIWISVDGGGTKTELCACDSSGKKVYDEFFGRSNYKTAGRDTVKNTLTLAFREMMEALGIQMEHVAGIVLAIAGCDSRQDKKVYTEMMLSAGIPEEKLFICNDTEVIFRALSDEDGVCVVAGTGSIVCAYNKIEMFARVGGWGPPLSDMGSGYWIGTEILRRMVRWLDGMEEQKLPVFQKIEERFARPDVELSWVLAGLTVTEMASVSSLVFEYAGQGDEVCRKIIHQAAQLLVEQITALCRKAGFLKRIPIVTVGGLFSDENFCRKVEDGVQRALKEKEISFLKPVGSPAEDGLHYARKLFP
ncbi:MAG: BadF/BadG/BcrA/BcrD ATPase family protein [Eubacteriales bacterium]|nr:BadF/BadG/BcrA/BcrD ATPase family protein [Eubacteriales bacterium]